MTSTAAIRDLLQVLDAQDAFLQSPNEPRYAARQYAAAGFARVRAVLYGICLMVEQGRSDVVGILTRTIFEVCTVCLYLLASQKEDGSNGALSELRADDSFRVGQLADAFKITGHNVERRKQLTKKTDEDGQRLRLPNLRSMSQRVAMFVKEDPVTGIAPWESLYDGIYKAESTVAVHPGLLHLGRYLEKDGGVVRVRSSPGSPYADQEITAAALTIYLGYHVLKAFEIEMHGVFQTMMWRIAASRTGGGS